MRRGLLLGVVPAGLIGLHYAGAIVAGVAALGYGLGVGLYDGETGVRVLWHDGQDALQLPIPVTVVVAADDGH